MLEIRNLSSFVDFLLLEIIDFLNLAKFLLFNITDFLFLDLDHFLCDPNSKSSISVKTLAILLLSSSLLAIVRS